jgi:predicted nuclease of restriction endonuclease-like RecB superfamily
MLRSEHSIVHYANGRALPDRLTRVTHRHYLDYAQRMLAVYRSGTGNARRELHRSVQSVLAAEPDCDRRRIAAFCKLLDDAGEFATDRRGEAAALRLKVFSRAAEFFPLVTEPDQIFERSERETKQRLAIEFGESWERIDGKLYTDVIDRQPLVSFDAIIQPEEFLSRYNLAQLQACLYKSSRMRVTIRADFAAVIRYAKLAHLLIDIRRISADVYRLDLSGPASVLRETQRYGINLARFTSGLVSCRGWDLRANVVTPWNTQAVLSVGAEDGYRSHVLGPAQFDSAVEEALASKWGEVRDGWQLLRDAGVLHEGQMTFVPDFRLKHLDGREAFLEIVGFWTPEYLAAKRKTITAFKHHRIVLAVPKCNAKLDGDTDGVVVYKTRIMPDAVVRAVEAVS